MLIIFGILVAGKLHGSSIAEWDHLLKEKTASYERPILIGKTREILSDEWIRQTPLYFSQAEDKEFFPLINRNIRSDGQNMIVSFFAPVFDITLLGKPFNWGFVVFGKEYGLSWYWWSKLLLLLLVCFELSSILTNGNLVLSAVGALWIAFSSYVQWGFNYQEVDLIIYAQAIVVVLWNYAHTPDRKIKIVLIGILTMSIMGFILSFHPAFQISIGYLLVILLPLFIAYINRSGIKFNRYDLMLFGISFLVIGISLYSFLSHSWEAIQLIRGTVWPGKRFSTGGHFTIHYLQLYLIDWLLPYKDVPVSNNFEASTFLNFLPAVLFASPMVVRSNDRRKYLWIALLSYALFLCSWLFFKYPVWFAKYSLFSFVTEQRLHVVLGLIAAYLSILTFSFLLKNKPISRLTAAVVSCLITLIYYASIRSTPMIAYLKPLNTILTLLFFFAMNIFFLRGQLRLLGICVLIYVSVAGFTVNPLARGASPIYDKVVSKKIVEIEHKDAGQKWAGINGSYLGTLIASLGVKSFNGIHYYPDMKVWSSLDRTGKYSNIYNRHGYVDVQVTAGETYFKLNQFDTFTAFINVPDLRRLNVKYLLSKGVITDPSLEEIDSVAEDNIHIYKIRD